MKNPLLILAFILVSSQLRNASPVIDNVPENIREIRLGNPNVQVNINNSKEEKQPYKKPMILLLPVRRSNENDGVRNLKEERKTEEIDGLPQHNRKNKRCKSPSSVRPARRISAAKDSRKYVTVSTESLIDENLESPISGQSLFRVASVKDAKKYLKDLLQPQPAEREEAEKNSEIVSKPHRQDSIKFVGQNTNTRDVNMSNKCCCYCAEEDCIKKSGKRHSSHPDEVNNKIVPNIRSKSGYPVDRKNGGGRPGLIGSERSSGAPNNLRYPAGAVSMTDPEYFAQAPTIPYLERHPVKKCARPFCCDSELNSLEEPTKIYIPLNGNRKWNRRNYKVEIKLPFVKKLESLIKQIEVQGALPCTEPEKTFDGAQEAQGYYNNNEQSNFNQYPQIPLAPDIVYPASYDAYPQYSQYPQYRAAINKQIPHEYVGQALANHGKPEHINFVRTVLGKKFPDINDCIKLHGRNFCLADAVGNSEDKQKVPGIVSQSQQRTRFTMKSPQQKTSRHPADTYNSDKVTTLRLRTSQQDEKSSHQKTKHPGDQFEPENRIIMSQNYPNQPVNKKFQATTLNREENVGSKHEMNSGNFNEDKNFVQSESLTKSSDHNMEYSAPTKNSNRPKSKNSEKSNSNVGVQKTEERRKNPSLNSQGAHRMSSPKYIEYTGKLDEENVGAPTREETSQDSMKDIQTTERGREFTSYSDYPTSPAIERPPFGPLQSQETDEVNTRQTPPSMDSPTRSEVADWTKWFNINETTIPHQQFVGLPQLTAADQLLPSGIVSTAIIGGNKQYTDPYETMENSNHLTTTGFTPYPVYRNQEIEKTSWPQQNTEAYRDVGEDFDRYMTADKNPHPQFVGSHHLTSQASSSTGINGEQLFTTQRNVYHQFRPVRPEDIGNNYDDGHSENWGYSTVNQEVTADQNPHRYFVASQHSTPSQFFTTVRSNFLNTPTAESSTTFWPLNIQSSRQFPVSNESGKPFPLINHRIATGEKDLGSELSSEENNYSKEEIENPYGTFKPDMTAHYQDVGKQSPVTKSTMSDKLKETKTAAKIIDENTDTSTSGEAEEAKDFATYYDEKYEEQQVGNPIFQTSTPISVNHDFTSHSTSPEIPNNENQVLEKSSTKNSDTDRKNYETTTVSRNSGGFNYDNNNYYTSIQRAKLPATSEVRVQNSLPISKIEGDLINIDNKLSGIKKDEQETTLDNIVGNPRNEETSIVSPSIISATEHSDYEELLSNNERIAQSDFTKKVPNYDRSTTSYERTKDVLRNWGTSNPSAQAGSPYENSKSVEAAATKKVTSQTSTSATYDDSNDFSPSQRVGLQYNNIQVQRPPIVGSAKRIPNIDQLSPPDQQILTIVVEKVVNDLLPARFDKPDKNYIVGAPRDGLIPGLPILKNLFSVPEVKHMVIDTVKGIFSEVSSIPEESSLGQLGDHVIDSVLNTVVDNILPETVMATSSGIVDEHRVENGKWTAVPTSFVPNDEQVAMQPDAKVFSVIENIVGRPGIGLWCARLPFVQNIIVHTVENAMERAKCVVDNSLIWDTLNNVISRAEISGRTSHKTWTTVRTTTNVQGMGKPYGSYKNVPVNPFVEHVIENGKWREQHAVLGDDREYVEQPNTWDTDNQLRTSSPSYETSASYGNTFPYTTEAADYAYIGDSADNSRFPSTHYGPYGIVGMTENTPTIVKAIHYDDDLQNGPIKYYTPKDRILSYKKNHQAYSQTVESQRKSNPNSQNSGSTEEYWTSPETDSNGLSPVTKSSVELVGATQNDNYGFPTESVKSSVGTPTSINDLDVNIGENNTEEYFSNDNPSINTQLERNDKTLGSPIPDSQPKEIEESNATTDINKPTAVSDTEAKTHNRETSTPISDHRRPVSSTKLPTIESRVDGQTQESTEKEPIDVANQLNAGKKESMGGLTESNEARDFDDGSEEIVEADNYGHSYDGPVSGTNRLATTNWDQNTTPSSREKSAEDFKHLDLTHNTESSLLGQSRKIENTQYTGYDNIDVNSQNAAQEKSKNKIGKKSESSTAEEATISMPLVGAARNQDRNQRQSIQARERILSVDSSENETQKWLGSSNYPTPKYDPTSFGKISLNGLDPVKRNVISELTNSDLFYVGNGVKIPIAMRRMPDGSYGLSIPERICENFVRRKCQCCVPREGDVVEERRQSNEAEAEDYNSGETTSKSEDHQDPFEPTESTEFRGRTKKRYVRSTSGSEVVVRSTTPVEKFVRKYNLTLDLQEQSSPLVLRGSIEGEAEHGRKDQLVLPRSTKIVKLLENNNKIQRDDDGTEEKTNHDADSETNLKGLNSIRKPEYNYDIDTNDFLQSLFQRHIKKAPKDKRAEIVLKVLDGLVNEASGINPSPIDRFGIRDSVEGGLKEDQKYLVGNHQYELNKMVKYGYQMNNPILERIRSNEAQQNSKGQYKYQENIDHQAKNKMNILKNILHWLRELFLQTKLDNKN